MKWISGALHMSALHSLPTDLPCSCRRLLHDEQAADEMCQHQPPELSLLHTEEASATKKKGRRRSMSKTLQRTSEAFRRKFKRRRSSYSFNEHLPLHTSSLSTEDDPDVVCTAYVPADVTADTSAISFSSETWLTDAITRKGYKQRLMKKSGYMYLSLEDSLMQDRQATLDESKDNHCRKSALDELPSELPSCNSSSITDDMLNLTATSQDPSFSCTEPSNRLSNTYSPSPSHLMMPVLELIQPGNSQQGDSKFYQTYRGQMCVSIYINAGLLTVHVMAAQDLHTTTRNLRQSQVGPHFYVTVSLVPDDNKRRSPCRTEVAVDSTCPVYDEKFSYELMEEDEQHRLELNVWNRPCARSYREEHLGSMSFGVKNILKRSPGDINGWYFLLNDTIGRSKHLRVTPEGFSSP